MGNGKLAIIMPTYRFNATARHCITTAAGMACDDIDVYIGDNSCNPEKWAFLRQLAERTPHLHVFCHETNIGGDNWNFLMEQHQHEYLCTASDDDVYTSDYFRAGLEELKSNPACAAASGLMLVLTWQGQRLQCDAARSFLGSTPVQRISDFEGLNTMPYAVHRRADVAGLTQYMKDRPFFPSYTDQFQTYTFLAQGTYIIHPQRQVFLYNNDNWSDPATCVASDIKYYVAAGLPEQFVHLHHLCWTAEVIHYFNSTYRPSKLSDAEAREIVRILYHRHFEQYFRNHLLANLPAIGALLEHSPDAIAALQAMLLTPYDAPARFMQLYVSILRAFSADLADRYDAFVAKSLLVTPCTRQLTGARL